jgi:hypothetical protein
MPVLFPLYGVVRDRRRGLVEGVVKRARDDATRVGHFLHAAGRVVGVARDEGGVGAERGRAATARIMPVLFRCPVAVPAVGAMNEVTPMTRPRAS